MPPLEEVFSSYLNRSKLGERKGGSWLINGMMNKLFTRMVELEGP